MKKIFYPIIGLVSGIINGTLGAGGGAIIVPSVEKLGMEEHHAHATSIAVVLPMTLVSLYFYSRNGYLNFKVASVVSIGGIIGGYIGAKFLNKISGKAVKNIFAASMIIMGIRMLWR